MNKKIILKVKQTGLMLNFNGKKFRSPVEIDITSSKIDPIISQMRSCGISNYQISTIEDVSNFTNDKLNKEKTKVIIIDNKNDDKINKLNEKIENIEYMLHEILNQNRCDKKEREQNNKDINDINEVLSKPSEKIIKSEKPKIVKGEKPKLDVNLDIKKPKEKKIKKYKNISKKFVLNNNNTKNISSKKIIIEELEDFDNTNIELECKFFKIKNFKYEDMGEPFKLSSDIEKLKKYKK